MQLPLTATDIIWAAAIAFFITWFIQNIANAVKILSTRSVELGRSSGDLQGIIERCYFLFPEDIIHFQGKIFKRGMNVRVTTVQHKIFEGELIGLNNENMLCVLTQKYIVAQELDKIEEMCLVEKV
jgi:hypothetical protein